MKKFFAVLLLLTVLAGAGFYFGWAQRSVPPDSVGVLRSRSHGTDRELILPGEFRWEWFKLIPTNARVSAFRLSPVQRQFRAGGTLPSGPAYAAFWDSWREDFSWEIAALASFRLRPGALVGLVETNGIGSQEDLDAHLGFLADEMAAFIIRWAQQGGSFAERAHEAILLDGDIPELAREIERRFPETEGFSLRIISARFPDFELYEQARAMYAQTMAEWRQSVSFGIPDTVRRRLEAMARVEELEMYGAVIARFPLLLEFMRIEIEAAAAGAPPPGIAPPPAAE
jgi:hypothetical protein